MRHIPGIALAVFLVVALLPAGPSPRTAAQPPEQWQITCVDCPKLIDNLTDRSLRLDAAGHPHIAYGGDRLYYAWFDGTAWRYETADSSAGVGRFASLDLAQNGQPHIVYCDSRLNRLLYAVRDAAGWHVETVDTQIDARWMTRVALALSPDGQPHIAYPRGEGLQYASREAATGSWQIETIDPATGDYPSLAIDGAGQPHASYGRFAVFYAVRDPNGWRVETLDANASGGSSLALDSAGYPHIAYPGLDGDRQLAYAYADAGGWHKEYVPEGEIADASLALGDDGSPHMTFMSIADDGVTPELRYAHRDQTSWRVDTIDRSDQPAWSYWSSVAIDDDGRPHILYHGTARSSGPEVDTRLVYALAGAAGWQTDTVDSDGVAGIGVSLAFDAGGHPHLSYQGAGLKHAYAEASGWHVDTLDRLGAGDSSLALDADGQIHVAYTVYYDRLPWHSAGPEEIRVGRVQAAGWRSEIVDRPGFFVEPNTSLALAPNGWTAFTYVYNAWPSNLLCYAYLDGAGWHIDRVGWSGLTASLVFGRDSIPHIVYERNGLIYASRGPTGWQSEIVAAQVNVPDAISLALDGAGSPHIAYYQRTSSTDGDLRYAYRDTAGWHVEAVDTAGNAGLDASLAVDASGYPHIAYYDQTNQDLKYATRDAAGWHVEVVDAAGDVGQDAAIALDADGRPCIGYYDAWLADLKLACPGRTP